MPHNRPGEQPHEPRVAKSKQEKAVSSDDNTEVEGVESDVDASELLRLIDRVRTLDPNCIEDLVPDSIKSGSRPHSIDAQQQHQPSITLGDDENVPQQIGRFRIIKKLGEGGFGIVFLAHDPDLDRNVALKLPRIQSLLSESIRRRFVTEGKAVARLKHRNIAAVLEAGQIGPIFYIVSEYCEGGSLAKFARLRSRTRTNQQDRSSDSKRFVLAETRAICSLISALSRAVQHAHDRGVCHRDLKPANVLFDLPLADASECRFDDQFAETAKIVDFGLAKLLHVDAQQTQTGATLGTPSYMSPEQADGDFGYVGPATDIYALGAILYELITGTPPFRESSLYETITAVKTKPPVSPRQLNPECPRDLEAICLKCLEKIPTHRYESAAAFADDLARFLAGETVLARQPSVANRTWRWCRRHPLPATFVAAVVALAVVGPIVAANQYRLYRTAEIAHANSRRALYSSDMNLALRDWDEANLGRMEELLHRHIPEKGETDFRQFEWFYLRRLWQQTTNIPIIASLENLESMAVSPDGTLMALGNHDGMIVLINRETGTETARWQAHPYHTNSILFSYDSRMLASSNSGHDVKLWDVETREQIAQFEGFRAIALSPKDHSLAFRRQDGSLTLRSATGEMRNLTTAHEPIGAGAVVFSPDGSMLASGGWDGSLTVIDVVTGEKKAVGRTVHGIWIVAWSPDGKRLATGDVYGTVQIWDSVSLATIRTIAAHHSTILAIEFSSNSETIATAAEDNLITLWRVTSGWKLNTFRGNEGAPTSLAFEDQDRTLISSSVDGKVRRWHVEAVDGPDVLDHPAAVSDVAFSADGTRLITACNDKKIRIWQVATNQLLDTIESTEIPWHAQFVNLGRKEWILTNGSDGQLRVWDVDNRLTPLHESPCKTAGAELRAFAVSRDRRLVAIVESDDRITIRQITTGSIVTRFKSGVVGDLTFSKDGQHLLVATQKGIAAIEVESGRQCVHVPAHARRFIQLELAPNGTLLASCSYDRTVKFWRFDAKRTGDAMLSLQNTLTGPASPVDAIAISPDGKTVATSGDDQVIRLWDVATGGQQRAALKGHISGVRDLAFSPNAQVLASCADDFTVRLWRAPIASD